MAHQAGYHTGSARPWTTPALQCKVEHVVVLHVGPVHVAHAGGEGAGEQGEGALHGKPCQGPHAVPSGKFWLAAAYTLMPIVCGLQSTS